MEFWSEDEAEYINYSAGGRVFPYKFPCSVVYAIESGGQKTVMEVEIVPNTTMSTEYVDSISLEKRTGLCVVIQSKHYDDDGETHIQRNVVSLKSLGYTSEPSRNKQRFKNAMDLI